MLKQVSASNQTQLSAPAGKIPIVVVPGIMGSRLMDSSGAPIWNPVGRIADHSRFHLPMELLRWLSMPSPADPGALTMDADRLEDMQPLRPAWLTQEHFNDLSWSQIHRAEPIRNFFAAVASFYCELLFALNEELPGMLKGEGSTYVPQVYVGGYDWRQSNADSANNHLAPVVAQALAETGADKVVLIGHSLGGQVSRYYARKNPSKVAAFIALASPHIGAVQPFTRLKQGVVYGPLERQYDDFSTLFMVCWMWRKDPWKSAQMLRKFPSMYQLMANKHFFSASDWLTYDESLAGYPFSQAEGGQGPAPKGYDIYYDLFAGLTEHANLRQEAIVHLDAAYMFHDVLTEDGKIFQPENSFCAYAANLETQIGAHVPDYGRLHHGSESTEYLGEARLEVTKDEQGGDSAVPTLSGWPQNVSRPFVDQKAIPDAMHGSFANDPGAIEATLGWITKHHATWGYK